MIEYKLETLTPPADTAPAVSIIGVGGAGSNVLDHIALEGMNGVELISMNCDVRSLTSSMAQRKVQLGRTLTQGLGCGGDPDLGHEAAMSSLGDIRDSITGRRMIFLCAGLGGGTSSGALPIVARLARETGAFVVVFATMPFVFEGKRRLAQAQAALEQIRQHANALVCFENDKMGELVLPKKGVTEAFEVANRMICQSVRAVTTVATQPGLIRIGLDDLVTALKNADSRCLFGFGQAKGEARATEALANALKSPLLDRGQLLEKARNVLVHICGGQSLTLFEIETLMRELHKHVSEEAQILFGAACDQKQGDSVSVTIISSLGRGKAASPFTAVEQTAAPAPPPAPAAPVQVTPIIGTHTRPVPILSVQPRQAPSQPSGVIQPGEGTVTTATSRVPVMQLTAQLLPLRPLKGVKSAPLTPPAAVEPDLFTPPAAEAVAPAAREVEPVEIEEEVPAARLVEEEVAPAPVEEAVAPVVEAEAEAEPVLAEVEDFITAIPAAPVALEAEGESVTMLDESTLVMNGAEPAWEDDLTGIARELEAEPVVVQEETIIADEELELEPVIAVSEETITAVAEEEIIGEPVAEEEPELEPVAEVSPAPVTALEEITVAAKTPTRSAASVHPEDDLELEGIAPQHPAFSAGKEARPAAPMRPIEIPTPAAARPAATRKFDLREILQRQRQTRLGQRQSTAAAAAAAAQAQQQPQAPARPQPASRPAAVQQQPQQQSPAPARPEPATRPEAPVRPMRIAGTPDPARVTPIRPIPPAKPAAPAPAPAAAAATRHASPFLPTRAPAAAPAPAAVAAPAPAMAATAAVPSGAKQQTFDEQLAPAERRGRFAKAEPTVEAGEDLDIPTFLRQKR